MLAALLCGITRATIPPLFPKLLVGLTHYLSVVVAKCNIIHLSKLSSLFEVRQRREPLPRDDLLNPTNSKF